MQIPRILFRPHGGRQMFLHRFFRGTSGNIEITEQSPPCLQVGWFRSLIAYVAQAPFFTLASLTVRLLSAYCSSIVRPLHVVGAPAIAL